MHTSVYDKQTCSIAWLFREPLVGWVGVSVKHAVHLELAGVLANGSYGEMPLRNGTVCKVLSIRSLGRARSYMRMKSERTLEPCVQSSDCSHHNVEMIET